MRELNNIQQSYIALTALDSAHIIPMQVSQFRQLLLGEAAFEAQSAESFTE